MATQHAETDTHPSHASTERTNGTVHEIEHDLGKNKSDHVSQHVRDEIYGHLDSLRKTDKNFDQDMKTINAKLQHDGYLPHMFIVDNTATDHGKAADGQFGPNDKTGFHLSNEEVPSAPTLPPGAPVDHSRPPVAPLPQDK